MPPHENLAVGSLAIAMHDTGVCRFGEPAVCYEAYTIDGRPGWSFIFERGRFDGFSPDEVRIMLHVTGERAGDVAGYAFHDVGQLARDHAAGHFAEAFARCRVAQHAMRMA